MPEDMITQDGHGTECPTPKQFRSNFKEIFESETTFGSAKAAREELLDSVEDIIKGYITKGCRIVYLHGRLKEAGYTGSRRELSEWLVAKGLWIKRAIVEKGDVVVDNPENGIVKNENSQEKICDDEVHQNEEKLNPETVQKSVSGAIKSPDPSVASSSPSTHNTKPQINIPPGQSKSPLPGSGSHTNIKSPGDNVTNSPTPPSQAKN